MSEDITPQNEETYRTDDGQEVSIDNSFDVVDLNSDHTHNAESGGDWADQMVPYIWQDKKLAIPQRWYWGSVVKRMINHNKAHGYTGCILIGMSGSGKTTLTQTILHTLHKYGENYICKWFNGEDMMNIDKIIDGLTVGQPHVIVMDDASYTLEDAKQSEVSKLANALTTIRHKVKSRVIVIFNIHYSKATKKFFRNQHFTFLTSVTTEELGNLKDLFQDKFTVIRQFGRKYRQMALLGHFYVPLSMYDGKAIKYRINEPFRLAVVSEITDLHFFVYPRERCEQCNPFAQEQINDDRYDSVDKVVDILNGYENRSAIKTALSFYCVMHNIDQKGAGWLKGAHRSYFKMFDMISKKAAVPWGDVLEKFALGPDGPGLHKKTRAKARRNIPSKAKSIMEVLINEKQKQDIEDSKIGPPAPKIKKKKASDAENDVGTPKTTTETVYPDYDSTYVPRRPK